MKKLEVRLSREPGEERIVGRLAQTGPREGGRVVFEYDPAFLRDPLWLSPFKLPPQPGLFEHRDHAFGPIFGLFDDSLRQHLARGAFDHLPGSASHFVQIESLCLVVPGVCRRVIGERPHGPGAATCCNWRSRRAFRTARLNRFSTAWPRPRAAGVPTPARRE